MIEKVCISLATILAIAGALCVVLECKVGFFILISLASISGFASLVFSKESSG